MTNSERLTKNERRQQAREKARELQQKRQRRERLVKGATIGGIIVAAVAVIAIVAVVIVNSIRPEGPGPRNMASGGIVIGQDFVAETSAAMGPGATHVPTTPRQDVIQIVIYQDYMCPYCGMFEKTNSATIESLVNSGAATVEYHPVSFLDRASLGTKYSTRAANMAGCVAEQAPDRFYAWNSLMFENQPAENTLGLDNNELIDIAKQAGIDTEGEFSDCVNDGRFNAWVQGESETFRAEPIPNTDNISARGTPAVFVNGQQYQGSLNDAAGFSAFVTAAAGQQSGEAPAATPAPSEG